MAVTLASGQPSLGPPSRSQGPRPPAEEVRQAQARSGAAERAAGCVPGPPRCSHAHCGPSLTSPSGGAASRSRASWIPGTGPAKLHSRLSPPIAQNAQPSLPGSSSRPGARGSGVQERLLWLNVERVSALNWQAVLPHMPKPDRTPPAAGPREQRG